MSYWKSFGLATFAGACLLGETTDSAEVAGSAISGTRPRSSTPPSGAAAAASAIWEVSQAPCTPKPAASTTLARWWE
jgi:hypothetical protein